MLGGRAAAVPALALGRTASVPLEALIEALEQFNVRARLHIGRVVGERTAGKLSPDEIAKTIARETEYGAEFERKALERIREDWAKIDALPVEDQPEAYRALLDRERRYAGQRAEATAIRAIRAVERVSVKLESPVGALWVLGPAEQHTRDCVAMAGKVWPWDVLETDHPPLGPGCVCYLLPMSEGVVRGLIPADATPVPDARRKRELIKTLYGVHGGLPGIREDAEGIRDALVRTGLAGSEDEALDALGRWLRGRS